MELSYFVFLSLTSCYHSIEVILKHIFLEFRNLNSFVLVASNLHIFSNLSLIKSSAPYKITLHSKLLTN